MRFWFGLIGFILCIYAWNIYDDLQDSERRAEQKKQSIALVDDLNHKFKINVETFLRSINPLETIIHIGEDPEQEDYGLRSVYAFELEEHYPANRLHLIAFEIDRLSHNLLEVIKTQDKSQYFFSDSSISLHSTDYFNAFDPFFKISCSHELLDYLEEFEAMDVPYYFGRNYNLLLLLEDMSNVIVEFQDSDELTEVIAMRSFQAECKDFAIIAEEDLPSSLIYSPTQ